MLRKIFLVIPALVMIYSFQSNTLAQNSDSSGNGLSSKRTSGVIIKPDSGEKPSSDALDATDNNSAKTDSSQPANPTKRASRVKSSSTPSKRQIAEAEEKARRQADEENAAKLENERIEHEKQLAESKRQAEEEKAKLVQQAEDEKQELIRQAADAEKQRRADLQAKTEETARIKAESEQIAQENAALQEKAAQAEKDRLEAENQRIKTDAERAEKEKAELETKRRDEAKMAANRTALITITAQKLKFLNPSEAIKFVSDNMLSATEIETALQKAIQNNPALVKEPSFCDSDFTGAPLNLELTADDNFGTLLQELRMLFGINFLPDAEVVELPVRVNVQNVPWNLVLRSQLNYLDLEARCTDSNTIAILKRSKLQTLQDNQRKTAPLKTEFIKLKYLQPVVGGQVNVAGRSSTSSSTLESLETAINKILKADGDNRGSISRIPGRNEFIITATEAQLSQIKAVIARADRPSYQIVIYSSIVTANEEKLKDIGGQISAVGGKANLDLLGGISGFGATSASSSSSDTTSAPGSLVPGGVRSLGQGFGTAATGGTTLGVSNIFGTFQLSAQLNLLQTQGAVKVDNRPSIIVIDGQTADLQIGRQVVIPIQSVGALSGGTTSTEVLNAGSTLNATPQVIEDENGNPVAVNLSVRIESNDVDTSVVSQGIPSIIRRSTQTSLMLNTSQTAVIGGFTTDSETQSDSKTPGLGDVPVIGNLFKRKVRAKNADRLYFAIRVEVISQGQILTAIPVNIDTTPRIPNPGNDFFKPYNQTPPVANGKSDSSPIIPKQPITDKPNNK